ncbi:tRNA lysidine(34) synthetase TilS [Fructilactobacillus lindneri]|uniref:tRNA(Ile)-lysidine synthase n=1 Tax=Fructilactobacillus lindneri TaxID=53444 RepID=A0AB33BPJ2_9LACO|nr:tRNA lysidine(34) synthetase TilS [Fructilactobacillus lindneri]ANZ57323.1 hypothetical protein AYR60_00260 [Fructilactobacillus lindneri]ANZ58588.1 hypothetical protein AYR59_00260 [Fructilactobacillus lindneri]POG97626.1 tRNA lysidine(34) synthetase TilS [Fructilactobacillus lindneri]POG98963.1 tRNA lysidine(34) synthetase TilS [Fructilactobacillus lindneri]POG99284.1 tRNA lysidine(34) synthetase TilS [Fructilactobacillus lindneri]
MDLDFRFNTLVEQQKSWGKDEPIVVAVSTGVDSMVLLHLLQNLKKRYPRIIVAHVNHQLRAQSTAEELFIRNYCKKHHLQLEVAHWHHQKISSGMENKARVLRYNFFKIVMQQYHAKILLTAHQQNDQAETVLMKLIRSGNLNEVQGIQAVRPFYNGILFRPLLNFTRTEIKTYAQQHQLDWFEDSTNQQNITMRNRIRNQIMPGLIKENKNAVQHLADFAYQLQRQTVDNLAMANDLLENDELQTGKDFVQYRLLKKQAGVKEILQVLLSKLTTKIHLTEKQLSEVEKLINNSQKPQGRINLESGFLFQKNYQLIKFYKNNNHQDKISHDFPSFMVILNHWYSLPNGKSFGVFTTSSLPAQTFLRKSIFFLTSNQFPLQVRKSDFHDRIKLKNGGNKSVRRLFIDKKLTNEQRENAMSLVAADGKVLAVIGFQESSSKLSADSEKYILVVNERD